MGWTPTAFGMAFLDETLEDAPLELVLQPAPPLRVRVLDSAGVPAANVPVALRYMNRYGTMDLRTLTTTSDGTVEIQHAVIHLDDDMWPEIDAGSARVVAAIAIPGASAESQVDPTALPEEAVELVLPETGALDVRALLPDGGLHAAQAWVALSTVPATENTHATPADEWPEARYPSVQIHDGRVSFAPVAVGRHYTVYVNARGFEAAEITARGPSLAGERMVVEVPLVDRVPSVVGRLTDENGSPVANRRFHVYVTAGHDAREIGTGPDGRFKIWLDPPRPGEGPLHWVVLSSEAGAAAEAVGDAGSCRESSPGARTTWGRSSLAPRP